MISVKGKLSPGAAPSARGPDQPENTGAVAAGAAAAPPDRRAVTVLPLGVTAPADRITDGRWRTARNSRPEPSQAPAVCDT